MVREQPWHKSARTSRKKIEKDDTGKEKGKGDGRDETGQRRILRFYSMGIAWNFPKFLNWVGVAWQRKFGILFCFFSFWFGLGTGYCAITVSVSAVA